MAQKTDDFPDILKYTDTFPSNPTNKQELLQKQHSLQIFNNSKLHIRNLKKLQLYDKPSNQSTPPCWLNNSPSETYENLRGPTKGALISNEKQRTSEITISSNRFTFQFIHPILRWFHDHVGQQY